MAHLRRHRDLTMWRAMWSDPDKLSSFRLDVAALRRLWRFVAPYHGWLLLYLFLTALAGLAEIMPPLVIQRLIDRALPNRDTTLLAEFVLVLGGLYLVTSVLHRPIDGRACTSAPASSSHSGARSSTTCSG